MSARCCASAPPRVAISTALPPCAPFPLRMLYVMTRKDEWLGADIAKASIIAPRGRPVQVERRSGVGSDGSRQSCVVFARWGAVHARDARSDRERQARDRPRDVLVRVRQDRQ